MTTSVTARLHPGALPRGLTLAETPGCGAMVKFEGLVRPMEGGRAITGLAYEAYEPMAVKVLEQLGRVAIEKHAGVMQVEVHHSVGFVPNHGCSFTLLVAAAHRKEALAAADFFIDEMKREVPIWKEPVYADIQQ